MSKLVKDSAYLLTIICFFFAELGREPRAPAQLRSQAWSQVPAVGFLKLYDSFKYNIYTHTTILI